MIFPEEWATLVGATGLLLLGISWGMKKRTFSKHLAACGWVLTGLFFFDDAQYYIEYNDPVLTTMTSLALPISIGFAYWEFKAEDEKISTLVWFRGAMAFAGIPYLAVAHIPYISVAGIEFVASQTAWMLTFSGIDAVTLGDTVINTPTGPVLWENYDGNKWFWANPYGEYPIQTRMMWSDGSYTGINIVLACTALQSMIVFIGAISVLNIDAKRKIRALILTVPTIHILNVFRNAGIIYLYDTFPDWQWMGIRMFEFAHTYAARVVSLFAMFLMATIMFQMLPEFHKHILNLLEPIAKARKLKQS
tara:strand:+ start:15764 stop:16681 length:918 start_codon:yes stop_codon:yes gene_type:complete